MHSTVRDKGKVERVIRYIRESFFAARPFTTLEDFNRQALLWRDREVHTRLWPGGDHRTVLEAFEEEKPHLLPLPVHAFDTDSIVPVRSGKTIYVRFDLNDYSIPPEAVGRPLTLAASKSTVRIFDGNQEITRHRRSYDRKQQILNPAHQEALLAEKRKAAGSTPGGRLAHAVPESEAFMDAAFQRGESVASQNAQLRHLLDEYGAAELRTAMLESMQQLRRRRINAYSRPHLLCIDELAYLSYDDNAADLLYEVINRRYEKRSVIITTNRTFKEWNQVFPNATCIATLLDRLTHHADVTVFEGESYRVHESEQESAARRKKRK